MNVMANLIKSIKQSESIQVLARRFVTYLVLSAVFILLGLGIGVIGYHWVAGFSWVDALVEASMIFKVRSPLDRIGYREIVVIGSFPSKKRRSLSQQCSHCLA